MNLDPTPTALLKPKPILADVKILVVDDCDENQFLFSHLLKRKGAIIATASNGHDCVQKALNEKFDIILMDIQMPVMDGYAALDLLKKSGIDTQVIAVTASTHLEEKNKINSSGFSAYVSKPIDKDVFIKTIVDLVGNVEN